MEARAAWRLALPGRFPYHPRHDHHANRRHLVNGRSIRGPSQEVCRGHQRHRSWPLCSGRSPVGCGRRTDGPSAQPAAVKPQVPSSLKPRVTQSHMPDNTRPSNIKSGRSGPAAPYGLDQFLIGIDHMGPGISTDSARGPETTGNNRDDPGKRHTRVGRPTPPWNGPPSAKSLGKTAGQPT